MGQPLDASIELALQPGEMPAENCVTAQVSAGDNPLPASQVSATLVPGSDGSARVRVRTTVAIEEPFLTVTLGVGCDVRFARQFTVFADPPAMAVVLPAQPGPQAFATPVLADPRPAQVPLPPMAAAAPKPAPNAQPSSPGRSSSGEVRRVAKAEPAKPVPPPNRARAAAVASGEAIAPPGAQPGSAASEQRSTSGAVSRAEGVARLKLDTPTVSSSTKEDALMVAAQQREEAMATAKIAVDVAEAANTSAAEKIVAVEAELAAARKELAAVQSALARLQAERAASVASAASAALAASAAAPSAAQAADEPWYTDYSIWLAGACAALLLLSGALYARLRRADSQRLQGWLNDPSRMTSYSEFDTVGPSSEQFPLSQYSVSPATIPAYGPNAREAAQPASSAQSATVAAAGSGAVASRKLEPAELVTAPAPLSARASATTNPAFAETQPSTSFDLNPISRFADISIEELLDVEQQAEFFVVLGQDDAAVELLTNHVMASGGASPMPFLKLLEIFRRTGDQTSYERTRKRFNARFNGVAPEWGADPNGGRGLVDYPEVLTRIQRSWGTPVDAMAELQTLMFRNDSKLLFELPAYRDIMMLFTLARDHHEARVVDGTPVDVLLPLSTAASAGALPELFDFPAAPAFPTLPADTAATVASAPSAPAGAVQVAPQAAAPGATIPVARPMDENLRMALEDPSANVQVSVRRR
jgi:pilus assembly protein FimV